MCPRSVLLLLVFACILLPTFATDEDVIEEIVTTPSSCGGGDYGYTEAVDMEDIEVSDEGYFANGTAVPLYSGEPLGDGRFCSSAKHCCSGRCINNKCCAPGKSAIGKICVKGSQCCSRTCLADTVADPLSRCCPRGTLAPGAACTAASFCCLGTCDAGTNTCCLSAGARVATCDAAGANPLCCSGACDAATLSCSAP